jgi:hypothetical protein
MILFISFSPFFRVNGASREISLLTRRVTQATRVVCEIPALHIGILRQSNKGPFHQRMMTRTTRLPTEAATVMLVLII